MTVKAIRIGSMKDIHRYENLDWDEAFETDEPIACGEPVDDDHAMRLGDLKNRIFPVGSAYISLLATNPGTLFKFGTWTLVAQGQFVVGYSAGDPVFGTAGGSGGNKNHTHPVNPPNTTSTTPSATQEVQSGTGVTVAASNHTHDTDIAQFNSGNNSVLPPYFVMYIWQRTA